MGAVIDLAHLHGWHVAHFRPAQTEHGWRTPVQADGKGWPDLIMTRRNRLVAAELKRDAKTDNARDRQLSLEQRVWLTRLHDAGAETYVWRPIDWPHIVTALEPEKPWSASSTEKT